MLKDHFCSKAIAQLSAQNTILKHNLLEVYTDWNLAIMFKIHRF